MDAREAKKAKIWEDWDDAQKGLLPVLKNGLTILAHTSENLPKNFGGVFLVVKVGWLDEEQGEIGFSHFLEHLTHRGASERVQRFVNNFASREHYHETLCDHTTYGYMVYNEEEMSDALKLLSIIATQVKIEEKHVVLERDVITVENSEIIDTEKYISAIDCLVYNIDREHLSTEQVFQRRLPSITCDEMNSYYEKWYALENMALLVVGNYELKCVLSGYAFGGFSESAAEDYFSHRYAKEIVDLLDISGFTYDFRDSEKVSTSTHISHYWRSFGASFSSPAEFEIALQKVFLLFLKKQLPLEGSDEFEDALDKLKLGMKDKSHIGAKTLEYAQGSSFYHKVATDAEIDEINVMEACKYFNGCFMDPAQFTTLIVGDLEVDRVEQMIMKYLGSIPKMESPLRFPDDPSKFKKVPFEFPSRKVRFQESHPSSTFTNVASISFPLRLREPASDWDRILIGNLVLIVQQRLFDHLRRRLGKVYEVYVEAVYDDTNYCSPMNE